MAANDSTNDTAGRLIPADLFSQALRAVKDNPSAIGSGSTIHSRDFYGNTETWVVETYRREDGSSLVFLQRNAAEGGTRFVLPAEVTAVMYRHQDQLIAKARRIGARRALETRRLRGDVIGNPAALRKARAERAKKGGR